jgi:hypothetical protein
VPPHGLEVKPFLRVRFAQPLSVLHTSRTAVKIMDVDIIDIKLTTSKMFQYLGFIIIT